MAGITIQNKRAYFDYDILETFDGGLVLQGFEVKSLRNNHGSLKEAYVIVKDSEVFLKGAHIPPFQPKVTPDDYDNYRLRKILLNRKEISRIEKKLNETGLTIVPIKLYNHNRKIKIQIGIARGKKKHDKRESLKEKADQRDMDRTLKGEYRK